MVCSSKILRCHVGGTRTKALVISAVMQEAIEVSVRDGFPGVRPVLHVLEPAFNFEAVWQVGAVDGGQGSVGPVDKVLLRHGAALVSAWSNNVLVNVGAEGRHSVLLRNLLVVPRGNGCTERYFRGSRKQQRRRSSSCSNVDGVLKLATAISSLSTPGSSLC